MYDERHVGHVFWRGFILLGIALFLSVTGGASQLTLYFDVVGVQNEALEITIPDSDFSWGDIYANPGYRDYYYKPTIAWSIPNSGGATVTNVSVNIRSVDVNADPSIEQHPMIEFSFAMASVAEVEIRAYLNQSLDVGSLENVTGYANASYTLAGPGSVTGSFPDDNYMERALYNGSNEFATLVGGTRGAFSGDTDYSHPAGDYISIPGIVADMQPEFQFTVGGNTPTLTVGSHFDIFGNQVPEPASVLLLGLGGLGLLKRRRS